MNNYGYKREWKREKAKRRGEVLDCISRIKKERKKGKVGRDKKRREKKKIKKLIPKESAERVPSRSVIFQEQPITNFIQSL